MTEKLKNKDYNVSIRLSHLLSHASVGAVVRGPNCLFTIKDIRYWGKGDLIQYVSQVKAVLGIDKQLYTPTYDDTVKIPATIFPRWMLCSNNHCRKLHYAPWRNKTECRFNEIRCLSCGGALQQVSLIQATPDGYMNDVNWHELAHWKAQSPEQKQCGLRLNQAYLTLKQSDKSRFEIGCSICHAKADYSIAQFKSNNKNGLEFRTKIQPWANENAPKNNNQFPQAELIEINDIRLHSPISKRALVIPPESRIKRDPILELLSNNEALLNKITQARTPKLREQVIRLAANKQFNCHPEQIEQALKQLNQDNQLADNITEGQLFEKEYQAFLTPITNLAEDEDFVTQHLTQQWQDNAKTLSPNSTAYKASRLVSQVVAAQRLREIWILTGFQRPLNEEAAIIPVDLDHSCDWLPALELYGEGIFLQINPEVLQRWEKNQAIIDRTLKCKQRFEKAELNTNGFDNPALIVTPRFMLLHALAHKLIKSLEKKSGYSAASLRERIYCSTLPENPMSGILIYTTVVDIAGTLGGLAELAQPKYLLGLLTDALESADWCSLDPICAENEGQGPHRLNRAACHSCELLPETSCGYGNILLDRIFICGNGQFPSILSFIDKE
ncbi:DUF1998 domain-containing protein [Caviibacterium pharyngocola]|uniref:MrfA-like Zn-binding domain-containing protein n=1 Tax=Caviibacterium pharyngocola TaxID=28159 RepID=A0A2M8RYV1_9PAST|nr:DUF1998 domain-containing protein [Caviibacterium pharyngocola]PJG84058.1 hypothetical protein CVP04_00985 [Caviibacterium pharyngocola]